MPSIERIEGFADELTAIRRDLHAHPEIGFEEVRTSGIVADKLTQWGIEVHRGIAVDAVASGHAHQAERRRLRSGKIPPAFTRQRITQPCPPSCASRTLPTN